MTDSPSITGPELFLLEAWVADNPGSRLFLKLGRTYQEAGRLDEAAAVLQRGLVVNPGWVDARQLLAQVLEDMGDIDGATSQLLTAAREIAGHCGVFRRLAEIWEAQGSSSQAQAARDLDLALGRDWGKAPLPAAAPQAAPLPVPETKPPVEHRPVSTQGQAVITHLEALRKAARQRAGGR